MTWNFTLQIDGNRVNVATGLTVYEAAIAMVERLYGSDFVIVSQETV